MSVNILEKEFLGKMDVITIDIIYIQDLVKTQLLYGPLAEKVLLIKYWYSIN